MPSGDLILSIQSTDIRPATDVSMDLGTSSLRFKSLYASGISASNISASIISTTNLLTTTLTATNLNATGSISAVTLAGTNISGTTLWVTNVTATNMVITGTFTAATLAGQRYLINLMCANCATFTDSTLGYWGGMAGATTDPVSGRARIYLPTTGTITDAYIIAKSVTMGTSEAWRMSIRLNDTTDTSIGDVTTSSSGFRLWSSNSLAIQIAKNNFIEIVSSHPAWATNPANTTLGGTLYLV